MTIPDAIETSVPRESTDSKELPPGGGDINPRVLVMNSPRWPYTYWPSLSTRQGSADNVRGQRRQAGRKLTDFRPNGSPPPLQLCPPHQPGPATFASTRSGGTTPGWRMVPHLFFCALAPNRPCGIPTLETTGVPRLRLALVFREGGGTCRRRLWLVCHFDAWGHRISALGALVVVVVSV